MQTRGMLVLLVLLSTVFTDCSRRKKAMPFWLLLGAGAAVAGGSNGGLDSPGDSNGVPLPPPTDPVNPTDPDDVPGNGSEQEIPNHGPARIIGRIVPVVAGTPALDVCGKPSAPQAPFCLDLTQIQVRIEVANGNANTLVATTMAGANGNFLFDLTDLPNNNYRVLINTGFGLNYAYQDFSFVHDPTQSLYTLRNVGDLLAERLYYNQGPALISGTVVSPGFQGDGVSIPNGPLSGIVVTILDSEGEQVATTTTATDGSFAIPIPSLPNGNYTIVYEGDSIESFGNPFGTIQEHIHFTFPGTNPNQVANLPMGETSLPWLPATESDLHLSGFVVNGAVPTDTTTVFTIKLKNEQGAIVQSTQITGNGSFVLETNTLSNGVYYIEVSNPNFTSSILPFSFTASPSGSVRTIALSSTISVVAKPAPIVGFVKDVASNFIPGATINFRPASIQPPSKILYLKNHPQLGSAVEQWIVESLSAIAGNNCRVNPSGPICSCAIQPTLECLTSLEGSGPWSYATYGNKLYSVDPSTKQVSFLASSGVWSYYISAPGFENFCGQSTAPCSANPLSIVVNGLPIDVGTISMTSIPSRSQIQGTISVRDTAPTSGAVHSNQTGLYILVLGNTDSLGRSLVHITTTNSGAFRLDGSSYVVTLPTNLPSPFSSDEVGMIAYALSQYSTGQASLLSQNTSIARSADRSAPVDIIGGEYYFRQSSYQIFVVDRTAPLYQTSYLNPSSLRLDTSSVASSLYETTPTIANLSGVVFHSPRVSLAGVITDAISTAAVSGAQISLGRFVSGSFQADIRRDCSGGFESNTCLVPNQRVLGADQLVGTVSSGSNGSYSFGFLSPGSYALRIVKNGITTYFPVEIGTNVSSVVFNAAIITSEGRGHLTGSVRLPGGFSFLGTYSLEVIDPNGGIQRPTAGVMPESLASGATTFSNAPQYSLFNINAGRWKIRFTSAGYKSVEGIVDIQANATTTFDIITFVPGTQTNGTVSGRALSALYNTGVCGLSARLRPGVNVKSGPYAIDANGNTIGSVQTSTDGSYAIPNVPPGNYTLEVSGQGKRGNCSSNMETYITTFRTVVAAGSETPTNQNILVTPVLGENEMRVVLSWGAKPRDLDSHLQYGNQANDRIVWNNKTPLGPGNGSLDYDITTGYGPETITLQGSLWNQPNRYYSIYNWSGEANMGISGAIVRVFKGSVGEVRQYVISPNHSNRWWKLFCVNSDKSIVDVGQTGCSASSFIERSMYR